MNFEEPHIKIGLLDLKQSLNLHGRDSRVVRWAMKWSRGKKNWLAKYRHGGRTVQPGDKLRVLFWLAGGLGDGACARRLVLALRRRREAGTAPRQERKEPEFHGPVYTVDYEDVKDEDPPKEET